MNSIHVEERKPVSHDCKLQQRNEIWLKLRIRGRRLLILKNVLDYVGL
jgi:hypothetical protein